MNKKNIKEKIKNYWNRLPCNIKYSNAAPMSMKFFNEISKKRYFCQSHIPEFANFSKFKNSITVYIFYDLTAFFNSFFPFPFQHMEGTIFKTI